MPPYGVAAINVKRGEDGLSLRNCAWTILSKTDIGSTASTPAFLLLENVARK
ncbi:MAG: hypothetical protein JO159_07155 [Acidobacteria bacterium]|nr:hypothetical protein [Acidobacteriota bacterium]